MHPIHTSVLGGSFLCQSQKAGIAHQEGTLPLKKQLLIMECLRHARYCDKCFTFMILQQPLAIGPILVLVFERIFTVGSNNLDSATSLPDLNSQLWHLLAMWLWSWCIKTNIDVFAKISTANFNTFAHAQQFSANNTVSHLLTRWKFTRPF